MLEGRAAERLLQWKTGSTLSSTVRTWSMDTAPDMLPAREFSQYLQNGH